MITTNVLSLAFSLAYLKISHTIYVRKKYESCKYDDKVGIIKFGVKNTTP